MQVQDNRIVDSQPHEHSYEVVLTQVPLLVSTEPIAARVGMVDKHTIVWMEDLPDQKQEPLFGESPHIQPWFPHKRYLQFFLEVFLLTRNLKGIMDTRYKHQLSVCRGIEWLVKSAWCLVTNSLFCRAQPMPH